MKRIGIAVLTVKPVSFNNRARTLLLPLEATIPEEKTEMIYRISRKYRLKIYLLPIASSRYTDTSYHAMGLLGTHRWLSNKLGCPVEYSVFNRSAGSNGLLEYAKKIDANILLLFAGSETENSLMKRDINNSVSPYSNFKILTIKQTISTT